MRFWGKIYGTQKDYWILEGQLESSEEDKEENTMEKRGEGVNRWVYWVTDNLLDDWIQLPDVKPQHLLVARLIKHVFTGNLNATIDSNPSFPGKERHFLRAQIARITHGTVIVPKGLYEYDDEAGVEKFAEEYTVPSTEAVSYTHLTEVFNRIMMHHPYDAFDKFEEISHLIKLTHLKIKDP